MATPQKYRLDKKASRLQTVKEANDAMPENTNDTPQQRLKLAWHLTCIAYNLYPDNPPRMDKTVFQMRKQED